MNEDVRVIMAPAGVMAVEAIEGYLASGNTYPLDVYDLGDLSEEGRALAARSPGVRLVDASGVLARVQAAHPALSMRKAGWYCKPLIMAKAACDIAIWLDHDAVVQGSLAPMVQAFAESGKWFGSPVYESFCDRYQGKRICQHGLVIYRPGAPEMQTWSGAHLAGGQPNDEMSWYDAFGGSAAGVFDLYRPAWYFSPDAGWTKGNPVIHAQSELAASDAVVVHYSSAKYKAACREHFQRIDAQGFRTDIVVALGSGSKHNNEELRYALRSAERNLKNLGQIFVVGERPSWLAHATWMRCPDARRQKDINIIAKVKKACDSGMLSEKFVFVSDDQILLQPASWHDLNVGVLKEFDPKDPYYNESPWKGQLRETLKRFPGGAKYYQPHCWMPMERDKFLDMCSSHDWENGNCIIASLYYNHAGAPASGDGSSHSWAPRGTPDQITKKVAGKQMLGYSDTRASDVLAWAEGAFPGQSKYESGGVKDLAGVPLVHASISRLRELEGHEDLKAAATDLEKRYGPLWDLDCEGKSEVNSVLMTPLKKILHPDAKKPQPKVKAGCKTCGDKSKPGAPDAPAQATAPDEMGPMGERDCLECCLKHLEVAFVQIAEYITNNEYRRELRMARGNLGCAEAHAARKMPDMAKRIRDARLLLSGMGHKAPEALRKVDGIADRLDKMLMIM